MPVTSLIAINVGVLQLVSDGQYATEAAADFPIGTARTQCPVDAVPDADGPLRLVDMSGVFVVRPPSNHHSPVHQSAGRFTTGRAKLARSPFPLCFFAI